MRSPRRCLQLSVGALSCATRWDHERFARARSPRQGAPLVGAAQRNAARWGGRNYRERALWRAFPAQLMPRGRSRARQCGEAA